MCGFKFMFNILLNQKIWGGTFDRIVFFIPFFRINAYPLLTLNIFELANLKGTVSLDFYLSFLFMKLFILVPLEVPTPATILIFRILIEKLKFES